MHHRRHRGKALFVQGIFREIIHHQFARVGDTLQPDRVTGFFYQAKRVRRDAQRVACSHRP